MKTQKCPECQSINVAQEKSPYGDAICMDCGYRAKPAQFYPKTNFDRITASPEALARFVLPEICPTSALCRTMDCKNSNCRECWLEWLNQEAEG